MCCIWSKCISIAQSFPDILCGITNYAKVTTVASLFCKQLNKQKLKTLISKHNYNQCDRIMMMNNEMCTFMYENIQSHTMISYGIKMQNEHSNSSSLSNEQLQTKMEWKSIINWLKQDFGAEMTFICFCIQWYRYNICIFIISIKCNKLLQFLLSTSITFIYQYLRNLGFSQNVSHSRTCL